MAVPMLGACTTAWPMAGMVCGIVNRIHEHFGDNGKKEHSASPFILKEAGYLEGKGLSVPVGLFTSV